MRGLSPADRLLTGQDIRRLCEEEFPAGELQGARVLAVVPDNSRTVPLGMVFRAVYEALAPQVTALDVLIALGTHPPLSEQAIARRMEASAEERARLFPKTRIFNHHWKDPAHLRTAGVLSAADVRTLSDGKLAEEVSITVNRLVFEYDLLLIIGPVFPHEVVGFSGGNKYLFPGISGQEIIDMFHWLGALLTSPAIIGTKNTPVRAIVDRAAAMLPAERKCLSLVVHGDQVAGVWCGSPEETWSAAADLSARLHVVVKERPFRRVLAIAPPMYEDLWTGGKCMYKLEPVVADGGELIIFAPHITEVSVTHGRLIEEIGYHVRDYFLAQWEKVSRYPRGILAHSTHVKGAGTYQDGKEHPRVTVTLATGIPEEVCRRINLGWADHTTIRPEEWTGKEEQGVLYVAKAGETLYRLRNDPFTRR